MTKARDLASNAEGTKPKVIDAAGDLLYGTGSDAATRLAIGTAGQVLQVNSGATAPEWVNAGGKTWQSTVSGSLSGTQVNLTGLTGDAFWVEVVNYQWTSPATNANLRIRFNNETGNQYTDKSVAWNPTGTFAGSDNTLKMGQVNAATSTNSVFFHVINAKTTTSAKGVSYPSDSAGVQAFGLFLTTNPITEINIYLSNGASFTGGTYKIWEYK